MILLRIVVIIYSLSFNPQVKCPSQGLQLPRVLSFFARWGYRNLKGCVFLVFTVYGSFLKYIIRDN